MQPRQRENSAPASQGGPFEPRAKENFCSCRTQQGIFQQLKLAALSCSLVGPYTFPPSSKYGLKMKQYRALQRSENFTTSTTKEEVASHGSPTLNQVLSATNTFTLSSPPKSKSSLGFSAVNVENIHPVMKQSETCNQVDGDAEAKPLFSPADQKQKVTRNSQLKSRHILTETKRKEIHKKLGFSETKVTCVGRQSKLEELKKLIYEKKDTVDIKSFAKVETKLDAKNVLVDLVQSLDTQEEIKPAADEWKVFFNNESDRVKALGDVGKQRSPMTSRNTSPNPSPEGKTRARKSGIPPARVIGVRKRNNDQICPDQQDKIPGQVDKKKEHVESSHKPRAEQTSDKGRKSPKQKSQSSSSSGSKQSSCNKYQHKYSEKQTVKRRWLPLPSNVTLLRLYGPAFCRIHKQKAKRDASKKPNYQTKLATFPEEPEEIDPKWDETLKLLQEYEDYCKGVSATIAEASARYEALIAEEAEANAQLMAESENPEFRHEMGFVPDSETKPAAEKVGEEPKEIFLNRREQPPNTDPKVVEEIDKLCAEEGISFSTDGTSSTDPILADVSEE